jgi:hypothetical protein
MALFSGNKTVAFLNSGGPKGDFALLEAPVPSVGMPMKLESILPLLFSSW